MNKQKTFFSVMRNVYIEFENLVLKNCFRYEGEFMQGWFHGHGIFWRADGMRFEGVFHGGRIWGLGLFLFFTNHW